MPWWLATCNFLMVALGLTGAWLVGRPEAWRKWGYVVSLASQPFFFVVSWASGQWGLVVLCLFYTGVWIQGVYYHVIKESEVEEIDLHPCECEACEYFLTPWKCNGGTEEYPCPAIQEFHQ